MISDLPFCEGPVDIYLFQILWFDQLLSGEIILEEWEFLRIIDFLKMSVKEIILYI